MPELAGMDCLPCRGGEPALIKEEIETFHSEVPQWQIVEHGGIRQLERVFEFKQYSQALVFTQEIGELAEAQDHHPAILTEWGQVTVNWWTHVIGGLHRNDFVMAAKTDQLYRP
jgi:4a-hydroxytetrahydrobiopterin dehydratase